MLAEVEGVQADFLQQAMDNPELLGTDLALRAEILGFLQMMFFRVPKIHTMIANSSRKTLEARIRVMEKNGGFEDMPDELKRYLNGRSISAVVQAELKNWFLILSMLQLGTDQALYKLLWPMNVAILVAKGFRGFIAGDAAVAIYDRRHGLTTNKAAGFASPTVEFSFPLSSRMLLLVGREVRPGVLNVSDDEVLQFNQRTIVWSERFLFAEAFDALTLRDIMALSDRQAGFLAENFDASDGIYTVSRMNPVCPSLLNVS